MHDEQKRRRDALKWLAVARQAKVDDVTAGAYLTGLADLPAWAIEKACRHLGTTPRGEYEDKWPELGVIRAKALLEVKREDDKREAKRLTAGVPDPISPEQWDDISRRIAEAVGRKSMR